MAASDRQSHDSTELPETAVLGLSLNTLVIVYIFDRTPHLAHWWPDQYLTKRLSNFDFSELQHLVQLKVKTFGPYLKKYEESPNLD